MSVSHRQADVALRLVAAWGLLGCTGIVLADEGEVPDIEFLEYLGSWEESDEDWVLFTEEIAEETKSDSKTSDPEPQAENVAELDNEN
jgi:hypothetical protein